MRLVGPAGVLGAAEDVPVGSVKEGSVRDVGRHDLLELLADRVERCRVARIGALVAPEGGIGGGVRIALEMSNRVCVRAVEPVLELDVRDVAAVAPVNGRLPLRGLSDRKSVV